MNDAGPRPPLSRSRAAHYAEGGSWAADGYGASRSSERRAWLFAAAAAAVAVLEALALVLLTPLKTVVPVTILVDRQTGYVETVRGLQPGRLTQDAAVTQSLLVQYVIARETFDATDLRDNYRKVSLLSGPRARAEYQRELQRSNPASPLNLYGPATVVATTIKSVSLVSAESAIVRFDTVRRDGAAALGEQRSWAAVIGFRYTPAPMSMDDRFVNPLGFQATGYRRDAETLAPAAVAAPLPIPAVGGPPRP